MIADESKKKEFFRKYNLERKIDKYIKWYFKNLVYSEFLDRKNDFKFLERDIRNLIEKMAIWYELRFPNSKLDKLMKLDIDALQNEGDVYNYDEFYTQLSREERWILSEPSYPPLIYFTHVNHIHVSKEGIILNADDSFDFCKYFEGKSVTELQEVLFKRYKELDNAIDKYKKEIYAKEEFFNCVMYKMIERNSVNGVKRAMLFAKEFKTNVDIPMMYAPTEYDLDYELSNNLKKIINEYLRLDGKKDLNCVIGYNPLLSSFDKIKIVSLMDLLLKDYPNISSDEKVMYLQILKLLKDVLNQKEIGICKEDIRSDEVYKERLERRLIKSRNR